MDYEPLLRYHIVELCHSFDDGAETCAGPEEGSAYLVVADGDVELHVGRAMALDYEGRWDEPRTHEDGAFVGVPVEELERLAVLCHPPRRAASERPTLIATTGLPSSRAVAIARSKAAGSVRLSM